MRSLGVVEVSPLLDQHLRLLECGEDFHVQALISELAVEAFVVAVLPGRAWRDEQLFDVQSREPLAHGLGDELRTVVRSDMLRGTMA